MSARIVFMMPSLFVIMAGALASEVALSGADVILDGIAVDGGASR